MGSMESKKASRGERKRGGHQRRGTVAGLVVQTKMAGRGHTGKSSGGLMPISTGQPSAPPYVMHVDTCLCHNAHNTAVAV